MHKRKAHSSPSTQSNTANSAREEKVTSEQLEDLRNFVASLINSLASHAAVLFNQITSEVTELNSLVCETQKKVHSIMGIHHNRANSQPSSAQNSQPQTPEKQPALTPSVCSNSSLEIERSIQQILEEFP